jgi:hypothetical protein
VLRRLDGELAIPLPERLGVLEELESDLEELTGAFVAQGHDVDRARRMAQEALVPDGTALGELRRIHSSAYARLCQRFGGSRLRVIERTALVVATTGVMVIQAMALMGADLSYDPSPAMWPILWLSGSLFAATVATAFSLWIKKEHMSVRAGARAILGLSALLLMTAAMGVTVDLYLLAQAIEALEGGWAGLVLDWLIRDGTLLALSMLASMAGGLAWFVFTHWLAALSAARAEALGLGPDHERKGATS